LHPENYLQTVLLPPLDLLYLHLDLLYLHLDLLYLHLDLLYLLQNQI